MSLARRAVLPLQVLLVVVFTALVGAQVLVLVGLAQLSPVTSPELELFRWTVLVTAVLALLCAEVVVVATWRLLAMVRQDRIFTAGSLPWVDAIVVSLAAAWLVLLAALVPVLRFAQADDAPGLGGLHLVLLLVAVVPVLLMVVMRALLAQATSLRSDLDGVV